MDIVNNPHFTAGRMQRHQIVICLRSDRNTLTETVLKPASPVFLATSLSFPCIFGVFFVEETYLNALHSLFVFFYTKKIISDASN